MMMFLAIYNDVPVYVAHLALWTDSTLTYVSCPFEVIQLRETLRWSGKPTMFTAA